jgi:hypothetical protein
MPVEAIGFTSASGKCQFAPFHPGNFLSDITIKQRDYKNRTLMGLQKPFLKILFG